MRKIRFYYSGGTVGSQREEIVEYDDDTSDEDIGEDLVSWVFEKSDANWNDVE